ncbi:MAG: hypothetical protein ACJAT2_000575 [Bacteriovoracaceae bacterium]|jgi:hypothetical protein
MKKKELIQIGWREFIAIPELKIKEIKVKVDTGARTSALHVTDLTYHKKGKKQLAEFYIHPNQESSRPRFKNIVEVKCFKSIKSSNGISQKRPVINAMVKFGKMEKEIEITLVNRDMMGFRMLLGRAAMRDTFLVNPSKSFLLKKVKK